MNEAEIIATTYYDIMNVYRPFTDTLAETGESVFYEGLDGKKIYSDIACALSSFSGGKANLTSMNVRVDSDYKLFYDPSIHIEKNDVIECWHEGRYYLLKAGKEMAFISHCELPANETKRTS